MNGTLDDAGVLRVWELGRIRHPIDRALLMLHAAEPMTSYDDLADLPIGERDARLLELRAQHFGSHVSAVATCTECGEGVEFSIDDLSATDRKTEGRAQIVIDGRTVALRALSSRDLAGAVSTEGHYAMLVLARRALDSDDAVDDAAIEASIDDIARALAEIDPRADLTVGLTCPSCEHTWESPVDPPSFLWTQLAARARRLLNDVHELALRYGWTEAETLALTPERREAYLELGGAR